MAQARSSAAVTTDVTVPVPRPPLSHAGIFASGLGGRLKESFPMDELVPVRVWTIAAEKAMVSAVNYQGQGDDAVAIGVVTAPLVAPQPRDARAQKKCNHAMAHQDVLLYCEDGAVLGAMHVGEAADVPIVLPSGRKQKGQFNTVILTKRVQPLRVVGAELKLVAQKRRVAAPVLVAAG